ncbi:DapH/DapD/GlmU-related protein [Sulfurospirillum sp. UCH001]|uniref:acyltransferase n=1 Tax=Sulfurospirillum sp. UCH001 TaxID=1581011 RepID=UPI00082DA5F0|nr:acyltransferase [Sulfurospirillum sp. UCH001]
MSFEFYLRLETFIKKHIFNLIFKKYFKTFGKKSYIIKPLRIQGPEFISIGNNVAINSFSWLGVLRQDTIPNLKILDGVYIGNFCHIDCIDEIIIGENTLIADKVYIGDNAHGYGKNNIPIINQKLIYKGKVNIGKNCWIGENVSILSVTIGDNCVIGAGSVVTKDIPNNSVAVGNPAKVIRFINN